MDAHFNDNEVLNSIMEILAERRAIRRKLMIAIQEIREAADRNSSGVILSERQLWQTLCAANADTSHGNDHGHPGNKANLN